MVDEGWTCSACTFDNPAKARACGVCVCGGIVCGVLLVAQRERSARARLKEKLQNAAYKQETVKWDSDSDSDESDDDEDL